MQAPVVTGLSSSSAIFARSTTTCILFTHDPSFRAMNATFLFPRLVRTQPLTTMSVSTTPDFKISTILCVFIVCSSLVFLIDKVSYYLRFGKKNYLRCRNGTSISRNVLPERTRFGPFVLRILPPGKIQVNLLLHSAYSHFGFAEDTPARQCSNKLTLPSLIRTLTAPKILRLGKNASELAFFSRLFVLWLRLRYSRSAMFK